MAYNHTRISSVLSVTASSFWKPSYLRAIASETLNWNFKREIGSLKLISLQSLLSQPHTVNVSLAPHVWGEAPLADLTAVCTLVALQKPESLFEFGTFTGHTTLNMAVNAPETCQLITLDLPPNTRTTTEGLHWEKEIDDAVIGSCWQHTAYSDRITQIYDDSLVFDPQPYAGQMDFIFVDACHEYKFVANDSEKAFAMLSDRGIVAWHDYSRGCPGVYQYLQKLGKTRPLYWIDGTQVVFCRAGE